MDTNFAPMGEVRLRQILAAIVDEGDAAEHLGLEAKSDIDPSKRGLGVAKIAKFILGMANRLPETASGHFKGYGVMVIGAEKGQAPGIPKGVEAHELADRLKPYLGPEGPRWDLARLATSDTHEVLFVLVEPPSQGQPPFACHKDFQPSDSADTKFSLANGDIYVRDKSRTRKAHGVEVVSLVARARTYVDAQLSVNFEVHGQALHMVESEALRTRWVDTLTKEYRESRAAEEQEQGHKSSPWRLNIPVPLSLSGPRLGVEEQLREFKSRVGQEWAKGMDLLASATAEPITFRLENLQATYLGRPEVIVLVREARALDALDAEDIDDDEILPQVEDVRSPYEIASKNMLRGIAPCWSTT
ncbi:hypothetical protein [Kocuria sp. ICS0012]|uniref:hypothetical protein n=1 Tax=Kocuria sp. ICS0012 TaxID=1834155 RepID=UPI0007EA24E1|nr:hypothetical protein [Kocuria sp. ICS0012]OBA46591.1 hypothetical protein A5728_10290 [Kocuria sp. ICS0012]